MSRNKNRRKTLIFSLFTAALINCAHSPKEHQRSKLCERTPSSTATTCSAFLKNSKLTKLDKELEDYRRDLENAEDNIAYDQIPLVYLKKHIDEGNSIYLNKDDELIFKDNMQTVDASGVLRAAAYETKVNGQDLFIKQYSKRSADSDILNEVRNAKYLAQINLGPQAQLVQVKNIRYLVMEKISGINIKDITNEKSSSEATKKEIKKMLEVRTESIQDAKKNLHLTCLIQKNIFLSYMKSKKH